MEKRKLNLMANLRLMKMVIPNLMEMSWQMSLAMMRLMKMVIQSLKEMRIQSYLGTRRWKSLEKQMRMETR